MSRSSAPLEVPSIQRRTLEDIAQSRESPMQEIRRARALLLAADGLSNVEIARLCDVTPRTVAIWRTRFVDTGVEAVRWDRRGRVPPLEIPSDVVRVLPKGGLTIDGRLVAMIGLYLTSAQRAVAMQPDHGVNGWADSSDPVVVEASAGGHRHFLSFLKTLDRRVPKADDIFLLLDRWPGQVDRYEVDRWLSNPRRSRFHLHFIPSPILWQRIVQGQLRRLTRRGANDVRSIAALGDI